MNASASGPKNLEPTRLPSVKTTFHGARLSDTAIVGSEGGRIPMRLLRLTTKTLAVVGAVGLLFVGGCSAVGRPPTPSTASSGPDLELLKEAREAGADPSQIAILEKGNVSFADYEAATNRALACMRQAGIDVLGPGVTQRTGLRMLDYGWSSQVDGLSDEQGKELGDSCLTRFSDFVDTQYRLQSSSLEAKEQYFVKPRPAVVECIRANGGTVKDEPTRDEAMTASFPIMDSTGVDCFEKSGVSMS